MTALLWVLRRLETGKLAFGIAIVRDWLPLVLTLAAFREMELFVPWHYNEAFETAWIRWDIVVLHDWHLRQAIESFGKVLPLYFEICYFLVYGIGAFCLGFIATRDDRRLINRFLTVYLIGTLTAYALFPYFPSQPPRYAFPDVEPPTILTWVRDLNLWLLSGATIHSGVFPSAHVSAAFSSAWGMFLVLPRQKILGWGVLLYAVSVSVSTIYGRYHYVADALAGFSVSLIAGAICLFWNGRPARAKSGV
jgi:membrane-associated phospholipid phosphatase